MHFRDGCFRQIKDAVVSLQSLLCRALLSDPGRDSLSFTCECVHEQFHLWDGHLKGEEGGGEVVCVCVCVFWGIWGGEGGGRSLLVTTCFSSSIHLSPQTRSSQSSEERNLISTCGTELKDNET